MPLALLLAVALACGGGLVATALPLNPSSPAAPTGADPEGLGFAAPRPSGGQGSLASVTLITGERVRLSGTAGNWHVAVTPSPSGAVPLIDTFTAPGGDMFVIPRDAGPYLGTLLDPKLFDVSLLARLGYDDASANAIPVTVERRPGRQVAAVPGLSAVGGGAAPGAASVAGGVAAGSLAKVAKSDAGAFGAALAARFATDQHIAAATLPTRFRGKMGGLGDVASISLALPAPTAAGDPAAGAQASSVQAPAPQAAATTGSGGLGQAVSAGTSASGVRLHTLTVNAIERDGQDGIAAIFVQNLDHLDHFWTLGFAAFGEPLAVSVPDGHYSIQAFIGTPVPGTFAFVISLSSVVLPDVEVSADTTVTADARTAKPITVSTPKPADVGQVNLTAARTGADGATLTEAVVGVGNTEFEQIAPGLGFPDLEVFATPVSAPHVGRLELTDSWLLEAPGRGFGANPEYAYYLDFPSTNGVPSELHHAVTASDLATVQERYAADVPGFGQNDAQIYHAGTSLSLSLGVFNFTVPAERTEYYSTSSASVWQPFAVNIAGFSGDAPVVVGSARTYRPGQELRETWFQTPEVPTPEDDAGLIDPGVQRVLDGLAYFCPVCRQDDNLSVNLTGQGDGGHHIDVGPISRRTRFYRNDLLLAEQRNLNDQLFPMLPGPATYRIEYSSARVGQWSNLDPQVDTTWTFTSRRPSQTDAMPSFEHCAPDPTRGCAFVPLIFARYDFDLDLAGRAPAGAPETFLLTGYRQPYQQGAPPIRGANVQVSFDDGVTWNADPDVTHKGAGFRVTVPAAPPAGAASTGYVSLRVQVADAAGNTLSQTIIHAYALPAAPAAAAKATGQSGRS